jgi:hypothetical protein
VRRSPAGLRVAGGALFGAGIAASIAAIVLSGSSGSTAGTAVPEVNRGSLTSAASTGRQHEPTVLRFTTLVPGAHLVLARLRVDAALVQVSAPGGVMQIPANPGVLGWWSSGSAPGSGSGHVVVVGHVNYAGRAGALGVLPEVLPGDAVSVLQPGRRAVRYQVRALRTYAKSSGLPQSIFTRSGTEQLVMITCGGPFDPATGNYEDNIVAYATPVG